MFSQAEIEQFIENGYVLLRDAFPREVAAEIRKCLWKELGLSPDDPSQWTKNVIHIKKVFSEPPFCDAYSDRVLRAFDALLGAGRYEPRNSLGWWPVAFPGFEAPPWKPPTNGWHVDGIQFHHRVNSRDQGLLPIFVLSDIGPGDGGTCFRVGSHKVTARILAAAEPDGLEVHELCRRVDAAATGPVIETNGRAGDVLMMHPFMIHARSPNTGRSVRFICNPCISFKEPMNLTQPTSPVEITIARALQ